MDYLRPGLLGKKEYSLEECLQLLSKNELDTMDVPKSLSSNVDIARLERKMKLRRALHRGYDVINNNFFVREELYSKKALGGIRHIVSTFDTFDDYYAFVDGDVYTYACYYQCNFSKEVINKYKLKKSLLRTDAYVRENIDDYTTDKVLGDTYAFLNETDPKDAIKSIDSAMQRFFEDDSYTELSEKLKAYRNEFLSSKGKSLLSESFILFNYYHHADKRQVIGELVKCSDSGNFDIGTLFLYFAPEEVMDIYRQQSTAMEYKKRSAEEKYDCVLNGRYSDTKELGYFLQIGYYFVTIIRVYQTNSNIAPKTITKMYFKSLEELAEFVNNDFRNGNFAFAPVEKQAFERYITDKTTIFPVKKEELRYTVTKEAFDNNHFEVCQSWTDAEGHVIRDKKHGFNYFFDFVSFLNGDLSHADLTKCDGLINLQSTDGINFVDARMMSKAKDKFGIPYGERNTTISNAIISEYAQYNEEETSLVLGDMHEIVAEDVDQFSVESVSYISDLHLDYKFGSFKTNEDVELYIDKVAKQIVDEASGKLLIIAGDTCDSKENYVLFIRQLRSHIKRKIGIATKIVFILGNHEFISWHLVSDDEEQKIASIKSLLEENGFYLLHNNILYTDVSGKIAEISSKELTDLSGDELKARLVDAKLILFGGTGFYGYAKGFRKGFSKSIPDPMPFEIEHCRIFEKLYDKVVTSLGSRVVIVATHYPKMQWSKDDEYVNGFIYVNGHTHRNYFYDDGDKRIYADNQIGYERLSFAIKKFYVDLRYDYFKSYEDGIFEISVDDYRTFYRLEIS